MGSECVPETETRLNRRVRHGHRSVRAEHIAIVYAGLGETNSALDWLERGIAQGHVFCLNLERRRFFDKLKGQTRFETLLNRCSATEMYRPGGI